jgi:hypothetical protein
VTELGATPASPWQNAHAEQIIASIRRECFDHVIVLNERHLRRMLKEYLSHYHDCRTHISLSKDSPTTRTVESPQKMVTAIQASQHEHDHVYGMDSGWCRIGCSARSARAKASVLRASRVSSKATRKHTGSKQSDRRSRLDSE